MKIFTTFRYLAILCIFAISFTSCGIADISTKVSIRFENISAQDIQVVNIDGLVIDEIKAGETTDYIDFKDIEVNTHDLPNLDISSDAFGQTYIYTYQGSKLRKCELCGAGVNNYSENQKAATLAKGDYTVKLDANVRAEAENDYKKLVVSLVED